MVFKLNDQQRKTIKDELAANINTQVGAAWKGVDLNSLSDDALVAHHRHLKSGSREEGQTNPDGSRIVYNEKTRQFDYIAPPQPQQPQPTNNCGCGTGTNNSGQGQQTQTQGIPANIAALAGNNSTGNRPKSLSDALDQFGTPEERAVWNSAVEFHNQQKNQLLAQIIANASTEEAKQAAYNLYKDFTIPQLQVVLATIPKPQMVTPTTNQPFGGLLPFSPSQTGAPSSQKALKIPVYNFRKAAAN